MKVLISLLICLAPLFCLEAKKKDPEYHINVTLSHDWIDFSYFKPTQGTYVLFCLSHFRPYNITVGRYLVDEKGQEFVIVNDERKMPADYVLYWMILPQLPKDERLK